MRDRDPSIDFDDLPDIQTEKRDNLRPEASLRPGKPVKHSNSSTTAKPSGLLLGMLGLIIAALFFLSFQLYAQATKLDARVVELEKRLSSTDESLSQSGVAMQVAFKELKNRVTEQEGQIDKLWSSAWKKNQTDIESHGKQITVLTQKLKASTEQLAVLEKTDEAYAADIKVLNARAETLAIMDASIKEQEQTVTTLKKQLAEMEKNNTALKKKIEENAGWIQSNNTFRQQTNQSLNRLEQQMKNLQPSSTTIITP